MNGHNTAELIILLNYEIMYLKNTSKFQMSIFSFMQNTFFIKKQ